MAYNNISGQTLGGQSAIFKDKSGRDLRFRSLSGGSNITITQEDNALTINATGADGAPLGLSDGINTFTAGTYPNLSVNITGATLDNLDVSGTTSLTNVSSNSLSANTFYSGSTDLSELFVETANLVPASYVEGFIPFGSDIVTDLTSGPNQLTGFTISLAKGFSGENSTVVYTGDTDTIFTANFSHSYSFSISNSLITTYMTKNDVPVRDLLYHRKIGAGGDIGNSGFVGLLELSTGDVLKIITSADTSGTMTTKAASADLASVDSAYRVDPTVDVYSEYAEIHIEPDGPSVTDLTGGEQIFTGFTEHWNLGFSSTTSSLTYTGDTSGMFSLDFTQSFRFSTSNSVITGYIKKNGVTQNDLFFKAFASNANKDTNASISGLIHLIDGDDIEVYYSADTSGTMTTDVANFNILSVRQTLNNNLTSDLYLPISGGSGGPYVVTGLTATSNSHIQIYNDQFNNGIVIEDKEITIGDFGSITNTGNFSLVAGAAHNVTGDNSLVVGSGNTTSGVYNVNLGSNNSTTFLGALAIGESNISSNLYSFSFGAENISNGQYSSILGQNNEIQNSNSFIFGKDSNVYASNSIAGGLDNTISGDTSYAFGDNNIISGYSSFGAGDSIQITGNYSFAAGDTNAVTGSHSFAGGGNNTITYDFSTAFGNSNSISDDYSFAGGNNNTITSQNSAGFGTSNLVSGLTAFAAGNGNTSGGDNSHTLGSGNIATGAASFAAGLTNTANQNMAVAMGITNLSSGLGSVAMGFTCSALTTASFAAGLSIESAGLFSAGFGASHRLTGLGEFAIGNTHIGFGTANFLSGLFNTATTNSSYSSVSGSGNTLDNSFSSAIIASTDSTMNAQRSAIIGGTNITASNNDTVYVPTLNNSGGRIKNNTDISNDYLATYTDYIISVDTTSTSITVTLPSGVTDGTTYVVKDLGNAGANSITVSGQSINIDGATTDVLNTNYQYQSYFFNSAQNKYLSI